MFYEYALEPTVLSSWERVRYFLDSFGPWKGRFLAQYPKYWKRLVYQALTCRDLEKKRIEERLVRLDPRVFSARSGAVYDGALTWLDNAIAENAREPFHAIIAEQTTGSPVLEAGSLDDSEPLWHVPPGRLLPREPEVVAQALQLLVQASTRMVIIDPYFRADQNDKTLPLVAFFKLFAGRSVQLEIHASDSAISYAEGVRLARRALPRVLGPGSTVTLRCWRERAGGIRLHNRYILTEIGGVQFGDSIESGEAGQEDRISILGEDERARLWTFFCTSPYGFDEAGAPITIVGT
jgi:hypothetical protein